MKTLKPVISIAYQYVSTQLGKVFIAATSKGICYLGFDVSKNTGIKNLQRYFPTAQYVEQTHPLLKQALAALKQGKFIKLKLDLRGTPFQLKVWQALLQIPTGSVSSYGELAKRIKHPKAFRAVGTAVGANPVCYFVPCHRVVPANGGIGNYHWGSQRKAEMLEWESKF